MSMARKGFISLDRTNLMDLNDQTYHVVCYPKNPIFLQGYQDLCKVNGNILYMNLNDIQLLDLF